MLLRISFLGLLLVQQGYADVSPGTCIALRDNAGFYDKSGKQVKKQFNKGTEATIDCYVHFDENTDGFRVIRDGKKGYIRDDDRFGDNPWWDCQASKGNILRMDPLFDCR